MIEISGRQVGPVRPCFIIAEAGVNHDGDRMKALELVDVAAESGADAVKFQTFRAEDVVTRTAPKAAYQQQNTDAGESQFEMLKRLELGVEDHIALIGRCEQKGIEFMSTPFSANAADMLDELGIAVFKIPSGEITNLPLIEHIARKGRPSIISTGMATLTEVRQAAEAFQAAGNRELALLHCVSNYPAASGDVNLRAMRTMAKAFEVPVGYSDHTLGIEIALASVALGACILEKHFTLDNDLPGPDHQASLEPGDLKEMVRAIRTIEAAMGSGEKGPASSEEETARVARRSLVAARKIPARTCLEGEMIAARRPGTGLPPSYAQ
jgi:N-acetylneuraminate synthase